MITNNSELKKDCDKEGEQKKHNFKAQKRRRKNLNRKIRKENRRSVKFSVAMSNWAHNFSVAANWQIKHELAFWKARAKALEYENGLLHDIIRKNHQGTPDENDSEEEYVQDNEDRINSEREENCGDETTESKSQNEYYIEGDGNNDEHMEYNDEFTVSEEYIAFIKANAKYKEDARRERERLKEQQAYVESAEVDEPAISQEQLKELYGEKWQKICALEISLQSEFLSKKDELKPNYWPNIPLNL